jgi:hypothetical protein
VSEPHFRVEKISRPIPSHNGGCKQYLKWAVICTVTGGRWAARVRRQDAEAMAGMFGQKNCWLCEEARKGIYVRHVPEDTTVNDSRARLTQAHADASSLADRLDGGQCGRCEKPDEEGRTCLRREENRLTPQERRSGWYVRPFWMYFDDNLCRVCSATWHARRLAQQLARHLDLLEDRP